MPDSKQTTIALLDVDNTLVWGSITSRELHINSELVNRLVDAGITQAWLFTDMKTNARSVAEREVVIDAIQKLGITVLGVSTPCDYAWELPNDQREARLPPPDQKTVLGEKATESPWPEAKTLGRLPSAEPGIAYKGAKEILYRHQEVAGCKTPEETIRFFRGLGDGTTELSSSEDLRTLHTKAYECRAIAGHESKVKGTGVKGFMYKEVANYYLAKSRHQPYRVFIAGANQSQDTEIKEVTRVAIPSKIVFVDDSPEQLRTVRKQHNALNSASAPLPWELRTLPLYQLEERTKDPTSFYSLEEKPETRNVFSNHLTGLIAWLHMPWFPYLSLTLSVRYNSLRDDARKNGKGLNALVTHIQGGQFPLAPASIVTVTPQVPTASTKQQTQTLTIATECHSLNELENIKGIVLSAQQNSPQWFTATIETVSVKKGLIAPLILFVLGGGTAATLSVALFAASKHFSDQARDWVTHLIGEQAFQYVLPTALGLASAGLLGLLYCAYRGCKLNALTREVTTELSIATVSPTS